MNIPKMTNPQPLFPITVLPLVPQTRNQHSWFCITSARIGERLVTSQGSSALSQQGKLEEKHSSRHRKQPAGHSPGEAGINVPPSGGLLLLMPWEG